VAAGANTAGAFEGSSLAVGLAYTLYRMLQSSLQ
jgi:hypothetical protein